MTRAHVGILPAVLLAAPQPSGAEPEHMGTVAAVAADSGKFLAREYASPLGRRRYLLFVPPGHDRGRPTPLVVLLHGCTQEAADFARGTRMNDEATRVGALVLYPEQPAEANEKRCWNWFGPAHQARDAGEPALIAGMTREVAADYGSDPNRTYIGGISAGAAMAVLTALAYPDLYAAVASHSGVGWRVADDLQSGLAAMQGGGVDPAAQARSAVRAMGRRARAIPLIALHGTADSVVRPAATRGLVDQFAALHQLVAGAGRSGNAIRRIDTTQAEMGGYPYVVRRLRGAEGSVAVEEWMIDGLGHAFSGGSPAGSWTDPRGPDAAREMLRFFLDHPANTNRSAASSPH